MIKLPYFADPKNLEIVEDEPKKIEEGPEGETSLQLLQTVYRDRKQPLNVRVRCAVEALVHEYPKLSATAHVNYDFAKELEKALERAWGRSANANLPRLNGPVEQLPPQELKKPFSNYRNNYRRY
jgi:hypothetical protein